MSNSKRDIGADLESPFLDEQLVGTHPSPDVTDQPESGEDEGTFSKEEQADRDDDTPLEELEAGQETEAEEAERYGVESEDQEPEVSEACEEELENGEDEAADWEALEDTVDDATESETDLLHSEVWAGTANQTTFRGRVLAAHLARSRASRGAPQRDLRTDELKTIPGTRLETLPDTADAAGRLLAAANADLALAQKAGDADARRTIRLTVSSGYRGSNYQRDLWNQYFSAQGGYYDRTQGARQAIPEGRHSDEAVAYMLKRKKAGGFGLGGRIAAPGYSNHQGGIALDFKQERTKGNGIGNKSDDASRRRWRNTWFHQWLRANAATHGFMPIATEEWHWEYRPAEISTTAVVTTSPAAAVEGDTNATASLLGVFAEPFRNLVRAGREVAAISEAVRRGQTDPRTLTNLVFFARHPELDGRAIKPSERELAQEWLRIRDKLVRPALTRLPVVVDTPRATSPAAEGTPPLGGPRVPAGYREKPRGLAHSSNVRLDAKLLAMRKAKTIAISNQDIDTLQRIANVETAGAIQALNTWDTGVVSIGFMQWTLLWGELQKWILRASSGFARYGIAVDRGRKWTFKKKNQQFAIVGANEPDELRWDGWAQRFYLAGLDDEVIAAQVQQALEVLQAKLARMRQKFDKPEHFAVFQRHYDGSPELRAIFQEAYNNRPVAAIEATKAAVHSATAKMPTTEFLAIYKRAVSAAFANQGKSASHLLHGTRTGARITA